MTMLNNRTHLNALLKDATNCRQNFSAWGNEAYSACIKRSADDVIFGVAGHHPISKSGVVSDWRYTHAVIMTEEDLAALDEKIGDYLPGDFSRDNIIRRYVTEHHAAVEFRK